MLQCTWTSGKFMLQRGDREGRERKREEGKGKRRELGREGQILTDSASTSW